MSDKILRDAMGIKVIEHDDGTCSYFMDEMCIMDRLPSFMKPMMIKSFENLRKIRENEQKGI